MAAGSTADAFATLLAHDTGVATLFADSALLSSLALDATASEPVMTSGDIAPYEEGVPVAPLPEMASNSSESTGSDDVDVAADANVSTVVLQCAEGFQVDATFAACEDVNECTDGVNGGCDARTLCTNTAGGRECGDCPVGFSGHGDAGCEDIDECAEPTPSDGSTASAPCDSLTACENAPGGYTCAACPDGYRGSGDLRGGAPGCSAVAPEARCDDGTNGGCDALTACTDEPEGGTACGPCPAGYSGSGDSACTDADGCGGEPCYSGVLCTDLPAPGVGYMCAACPGGFVGDGEVCFGDPCESLVPCDPLVTCTSMVVGGRAEFTCGECPKGYTKEGSACAEVDECAQVDRGGCDAMVTCTNTPGGHECGACPENWLGSGNTRCLPSSSCAENNGGCDPLTSCQDPASGIAECGECPAGYSGTGATGCVDEDGCASGEAGGCYGACLDVPAPSTGFSCASCPSGMAGDGFACVPNLCYTSNGGCDTAVTCTMNVASGARECGECPIGLQQVPDSALSSGWRCGEVDGCAEEPCWSSGDFFRPCMDVLAPGTGRVCGECPAGFAAGADGLGCVDVDECAQTTNGGCWVSPEDPTVLAVCINTPGAHTCGACPARYIGTGEAGCRERVMCNTNNGNCDPLVSCTDNLATGYADCGPCPAGYSGTGDTACVDTDGCALEPCFTPPPPGVPVVCSDTPAPGEGRACGNCPEGYKGDGAQCEVCTVLLGLDYLMSTAVEGTMKRSSTNQVAGVFGGLEDPQCVLSQGMRYMWAGVTSDGATVPLDSTTNMRETLTLYLPKSTLTANVAYTLRLTASLRGAPQVKAAAELSFLVKSQALVALIKGGSVQTGEGLPVALDAAESYDPDGEPGELAYSWNCQRTDAGAAAIGGQETYCRDVSGSLLPPRMSSAVLSLTLAGTSAGAEYSLTCHVAKAERSAQASTTVTIVKGSPPVPAIAPLPQKHTPNSKLTLISEVQSLRPETLQRMWSVEAGGGAPVDLASVSSTTLDGPNLVLKPNALAAGAEYWFTLSATDGNGPSSVKLQVRVNSLPHSGSMAVVPLEGVMSETSFDVTGMDWEDDPEDKPLWYQLRYVVVGGGGAGEQMLTQWQPSPEFNTTMTVSGLEDHAYLVDVLLYVKDALEATAHVTQTITVKEMTFEDDGAKEHFIDSAIDTAAADATNGKDTSSILVSLTSVMDAGGTAEASRRRRLLQAAQGGDPADAAGVNVSVARRAQRQAMMEVAGTVWELLPPTTDTVTRMAQSTSAVASDPGELTAEARAAFSATAESLVDVTRTGDPDSQLGREGAAAIMEGLSSVTVGAVLDRGANQSSEVAMAVEVVRAIGFSNMQSMVPEEEAAVVATEVLSSYARRADLTSSASQALTEPLLSPNGVALRLSSSLGSVLGEAAAAADIMMVGSAVDPNGASDTAREAAAHRLLLGTPPAASRALLASDVTSISLFSSANGSELAVHNLQEALTFTLPISLPEDVETRKVRDSEVSAPSPASAPFMGAACKYWDTAMQTYTTAGCATLPNPVPPHVRVFWHTTNVSTLPVLEAAWAAEGDEMTAGCEEEWGALFPEYLGTDAGLRKYVGAHCQLADPGNNASCWWEWRAQMFEGPGCVWAAEASCLCTHLTDFAAAQQTQIGSAEPPKVSGVSGGDMTSVSPQDVGKSVVLVAVLAIFMLGAPLLYVLSNSYHNRERLALLLKMVDKDSTTFEVIDSVWTWSIVDHRAENSGEQSAPSGPTLGTMFGQLAAKEKARLVAEREGTMIRRVASKWKRRLGGEVKAPALGPCQRHK
ncbi:hypothetical protein CYMTET_28234, partial [Cymbomonas tetramitiformis]